MMNNQLSEKIKAAGVLPVFCPKDMFEYETFRDAIMATTLPAVEITLRNEFAANAARMLKKDIPHLAVGVGTVLSFETLDTAIDIKADFLVSPGYSHEIVKHAIEMNIPFLPGVSTPSEIQNALLDGITTLKFFPAEISGGTKALTLYGGAFKSASFIPTGGITLDNIKSYLALKNVTACGGSFMIPHDKLASGDSGAIARTIMNCLRSN